MNRIVIVNALLCLVNIILLAVNLVYGHAVLAGMSGALAVGSFVLAIANVRRPQ